MVVYPAPSPPAGSPAPSPAPPELRHTVPPYAADFNAELAADTLARFNSDSSLLLKLRAPELAGGAGGDGARCRRD